MEDVLEQVRQQHYLSVTSFLNKVVHPLRAPPTHKGKRIDTAMHIACRKGHVAVVRSLMAEGARWDIIGAGRSTAKEESRNELRMFPTKNPTEHRKIAELLSKPLPPCPRGHRCGSVCITYLHRWRLYIYACMCDFCIYMLSVSARVAVGL